MAVFNFYSPFICRCKFGVDMDFKISLVKDLSACVRKLGSQTKSGVVVLNSSALKTLPKDTFCHQYWQQIKSEGMLKPSRETSVRLHGYLNGINHHLVTGAGAKNMDKEFMSLNLTPRDMITLTDIEFKKLKPTTETIHAFRSIGEKLDFFSEYKLYKKRLDIKKGEIIDMKEYAYATSDINYASGYLTNNRGILYDIEIPKGAKVSIIGDNSTTNEIVFPRSSKFECIGKEHVQDANSNYMKIKLKYLVSQEI